MAKKSSVFFNSKTETRKAFKIIIGLARPLHSTRGYIERDSILSIDIKSAESSNAGVMVFNNSNNVDKEGQFKVTNGFTQEDNRNVEQNHIDSISRERMIIYHARVGQKCGDS